MSLFQALEHTPRGAVALLRRPNFLRRTVELSTTWFEVGYSKYTYFYFNNLDGPPSTIFPLKPVEIRLDSTLVRHSLYRASIYLTLGISSRVADCGRPTFENAL